MNRREFVRFAGGAVTFPALFSMSCSTTRTRKTSRRPNVLFILADDMGYSDAECYGGEVRTPNLSSLAANGLRFTQHYSCGRCWPSRASLLTGYYAQHIRRDRLPGIKMGNRPAWAPLLPAMLKPCGCKSYHSGKWHIDGTAEQGGFDHSWGTEKTGCDWNRYFDSQPWKEDDLQAPVKEGQPYYSTIAIADHAIACLKLHERNCPDTPFFQYVAFYSPHFPLQALQKDIDKYRDTYNDGWDRIRMQRLKRMQKMGLVNCKLSEREPDAVPSWNLSAEELQEEIGPGEVFQAVAWDTLTDKQKEFQATKMAIHAAMITRMDHEIGRIIDQLKQMDAYENTLILFASDNGASAEQIIRGDGDDSSAPMGSAKRYLCLGPGWSTAANTPFRLHKHWNHEGGISSPLIAHWPAQIHDNDQLRHDPCHFIDIVPTVMDLAKVNTPDDSPNPAPAHPGKSLIPAFSKDGAVNHDYLWWAHEHNRAIRQGKWKLSARVTMDKKTGPWELYDISVDRCEMNNLAAQHPNIVKQLDQKWHATVRRFLNDLQT